MIMFADQTFIFFFSATECANQVSNINLKELARNLNQKCRDDSNKVSKTTIEDDLADTSQ